MVYAVSVRVGQSATGLFVEDPDRGVAVDGVAVLSGLTFGWSMPGPMWPQQPDPMRGGVVVNVPDFGSDWEIDPDGETLQITVSADYPTGDIIASFYGDITDYRVTTRPGRPGVFITAAAVDYTVRLKEGRWYGTLIDFGVTDHAAIDTLWAKGELPGSDAGTGLGRAGSTVVWSAPDRLITPDALDVAPRSPYDLLNQLLVQAVDVPNSRRMIVAPMVGNDGELLNVGGFDSPHLRTFTLDVIDSDFAAGTPVWDLPASACRRDSLAWSWNKTNKVHRVDVGGYGGDASHIAYATTPIPPPAISGSTIIVLPTTLNTLDDSTEVATFYTDRSRFDSWQVDAVDVEVSKAGIGADVPVGLFPDWFQGEDDPARSACYSALVNITDADTTRTPDGLDTITGRLTGATCTIADGKLVLGLELRRLVDITLDNPDFVFTGYAMAPFGALAHV